METAENKDHDSEHVTESLVRLTARDKELLAHVAMARYLSSAQIKRLVFASGWSEQQGRDRARPPSDQVCRRRLGRLSSGEGGIAYLHRFSCRSDDGQPILVYGLTPHGQGIARVVLRRPTPLADKDAKAPFVARTVALNEFYVELAEAAAKAGRRPAQFPFTWIAADSAGLPWREQDQRTGRIEERRLLPDAVLELPAERTRVFLECEPAVATREGRVLDSAMSKLNRYGDFMLLECGHTTFYRQKYADGWKAELMFSPTRESVLRDSRAGSASGASSTEPCR